MTKCAVAAIYVPYYIGTAYAHNAEPNCLMSVAVQNVYSLAFLVGYRIVVNCHQPVWCYLSSCECNAWNC